VSWAGSDALSGIADYNVYVSDNGGPYAVWKNHVTSTSGTFTGVNGHAYGFYSVATDHVGNVELAPGSPDATTTITVGVESPSLPRQLGLRMSGGHPQRGALQVELAIPRTSAGKIEVLDVAGRAVAAQEVGSLAPGWHTMRLADASLPPGLYLIRVTQGGRSITLKSIHLR
jgi:hypothetical protein